MTIAEIRDLSYTYPEGPRPALQDLDLVLADAELVLMAGRSGCGKSTLLRALAGLVPHFYGGRFSGHVRIRGRDTRTISPVELAGQVGLVFQEPETRFVTGSVEDEIAFGLEIAGLDGATIRTRVAETVERLELGGLARRPLDRLSGGEQQRVAVAAALARQPQLLLLDEPTSQLDSQSADEVLDWLVELRAELGLTALIAEHRLARLIPRVGRLLHLADPGTPTAIGTPGEILPRMPFADPLTGAARSLGLTAGLDPADQRALRQRILSGPAVAGMARSIPSGPPRLAVRDLSFAYNGIPALSGVSLEVKAGEIVVVTGRNGSGKTTLLRSLMGLLRPQSGQVWLEGSLIDDRPAAERARAMAYVPQWPSALLFADSLRQELSVTLANHGLSEAPPVDPEALLEDLALAGVAERYPRDLSAGERQRAAIATVLIAGPQVILLDEPTLGIDPLAQAQFGSLLERWRQRGIAVLLATHDVEFAGAHADTVLVLDRGRVIDQGPAAETLFAHRWLRTAVQRLTRQARPAVIPGPLPASVVTAPHYPSP